MDLTLLPLVVVISIVFAQQTAMIAISSAQSTLSAPFRSLAAPPTTGALTPAVGTDVGSMNSILNSSNTNFSWGWIGAADGKFLLSIVYISSGDAGSGSGSGVGGSIGAQQVWMANRNHPVSEKAVVELGEDGNLRLRDTDGSIAWSTGTETGASIELQDSGNLVVWNANGSAGVWQSFDHPSDTLLPGQVIGTGTRLIASVSYTNVSEGKYSVVMEQGGLIMFAATPAGSLPYHVVGFSTVEKNNTVFSVQHPVCQGTTMSYSTGGGIITFRQEPNLRKPECNHSFIVTIGSNDNNSDVFFRLDPDGNFRTYVYRLQYGWGIDQEIFSGSLICALPGKCGDFGLCSSYGSCSCPQVRSSSNDELFRARNPSDPTSGCALSQPPTCNGSNQLVELTEASYFANDFVYQSSSSLSVCKSSCSSSCSCAVAFYQQSTRNCYHYSYIMSIQSVADPGFRAFIKVGNESRSVSSYDPLSAHSSDDFVSRKMILGFAVSGALVITLCLVSFMTILGVKFWNRLAEMYADDAFLESLPGLPTSFSFKELHKATDGFQKKLGSGGFGSVYEGVLADGSRVAVKRLESARQGHKEFHAEVAALGSINHLNLVRLHGFCTQRSQRMLVYEYMASGSLDRWLFPGDDESRFLDWPTRFNIALDTARGLVFLHEESRERIVHLDIKPQNILLDESFIAKLSDFGLSKLMGRGDESDVVTNMRGTPGYVAPEWLLRAAVTSKSDVYSYGMVLLELVSGRKNLDPSRDTFWYFPAWAVTKMEEGKMTEILDTRLETKLSQEEIEEVRRVIKVAMWCIQEDPSSRPSMSSVVRILEGHSEVDDPPSLLQFAMRIRSATRISSSIGSSDHAHPCFSQRTDIIDLEMTNSVLSGPR